MIKFFKPQKGKAFDKLPSKTLATFDNTNFMVSTKYDGNQIFIVKVKNVVRMFTSDWKEFYVSYLAGYVCRIEGDFVLIGEFLHGCRGKLGDRTKSAILTTYRTNHNKCLLNNTGDEMKARVMVFDCMLIANNEPITNVKYSSRLDLARKLLKGISCLVVVDTENMSGSEAVARSKELAKSGWEGVMAVEDTTYHINKRVNSSIKLKHRPTADLKCIDIEDGSGKYENLIGSLVLQDSSGRVVKVGSGLTDAHRAALGSYFIGKIIEIEYEQIIDTYVQPTFVCVRFDKKEID